MTADDDKLSARRRKPMSDAKRPSRHPLLRRPKGALCSKPPNGPPDFPAASKFLPTPHHNPLRGGRKIRRPIVTSPSRLHRAHAAALGIVAAAEELLVGLWQSALQHPRDKPLPNRPLHPVPPQDANQNLEQQNATQQPPFLRKIHASGVFVNRRYNLFSGRARNKLVSALFHPLFNHLSILE